MALDTSYTDQPTCPKCGHIHRDAWEWGSDEDGEKECDSCGEAFRWSRHVSISWSTKAEP